MDTTESHADRSASDRPSERASNRAAARSKLDALPSANLGHWPTPFHRLNRFSAAISSDGSTDVWIKRDDVQSVALAGNKLRKFDLVLGQALSEGADTLITTGSAQSNSARTGAAAAAAIGMDCVLVLRGDEPETPTGNLFLDRLVGADIRFVGDRSWRDLNEIVDDVAGELRADGKNPVAAPIGCSSPLGALGFARAFLELDAQLNAAGIEPGCIIHTSTSGGSHAGLLVGRALTERSTPIVGIDAGQLFGRDPRPQMLALADSAAALVGLELGLTEDDLDVRLDYIGDGYASPTDGAREAIELLAATEAVVVDPVYSGKGAAGLIDIARSGRFEGPLVFWHTGGYHALFDPAHGSAVLPPR